MGSAALMRAAFIRVYSIFLRAPVGVLNVHRQLIWFSSEVYRTISTAPTAPVQNCTDVIDLSAV